MAKCLLRGGSSFRIEIRELLCRVKNYLTPKGLNCILTVFCMWHLAFPVLRTFLPSRTPLCGARPLPAFPGAPGAALVACGGALRSSMAQLHAILTG